jgi:prepilin-type N-terminal cleavage/methylation domain-containing protein
LKNRRPTRQDGFSLIEVIVALGLMAGVLISVAGLFVIGERQVLRGRNQSTALVAAQTILEEICSWNHNATFERFDSQGNVTSLNAATTDTNPASIASKWQPFLQDALSNGRAEIRIESCNGDPLNDTPVLRVVVTVLWDEKTQTRRTELAAVRL